MSTMFEQVDAWVDLARRHKIRATSDPRNLNPPAVLFTPPTLTRDTMCDASAQWRVYVIGSGPGNLDAWRVLDGIARDLVEHVLPDVEDIEPTTYGVDDTAALPALLLTFSGSVTWP